MTGKNINFDDKNINKSNFHRNKKLFNIDDIVCLSHKQCKCYYFSMSICNFILF